ncbi:tRNA uridine(34) 5-carboxymethylaminomethyl modification radical SAM/GNAT enzyme Elp3 [Methanofollis fontis]|uniref:tRNA carboxymethyluridine synthase n=1 Tax=Methanofollis fontis TaxID=2052832 RepID=A0A483CUA1_9EURY|nr:tRNA uridine(34) 5-carboxymethylaminomethyl modification radical SAM/GNAT enzyme Elp3 [Methanofollis fontis]TAJ44884.1 tRNA uridine(34) 5-carboxymethylaminomethyl modification radical SAM/GNAT enzyme Elp3 [Methanofollis fontis]
MDETDLYREIISRISSQSCSPADLQRIKIDVCRKYGASTLPKNSAILAAATPEEAEALRSVLLVKPTRTLSGVAPIAVMTSPAPCPHGICLPCPGGPEHPFGSPQSYTGQEPAALRGTQNEYDPCRMVQARLTQLEALGHHVDKAELIVMGGTITARTREYREWFVTSCIHAMNEYGTGGCSPLPEKDEVFHRNETAAVRCIATTFETRPDWCRREHVMDMLDLGVTKVELGVQHTDDGILAFNRRGCTVEDAVEANRILRDTGIKVGFHVMPNLPSSTLEADQEMFSTIFADERFRPDFLKIYPTLVTPGSAIEDLWRRGDYAPYNEDDLIGLIAYAKSLLPEYVRLQRVQRDIPARLIVAGSRHSNFRQLAQERLQAGGGMCRCIRCREAGRRTAGAAPALQDLVYRACNGEEHFIQAAAGDALIGFARLRFPSEVIRPELEDAALLRELHVYGMMVRLGKQGSGGEYQHRRYGSLLLTRAEETAAAAGYTRMAVNSGIGVRPYYRGQGYCREGPYMVKRIS